MDHAYAQAFFERHNPEFQYLGNTVFCDIFTQCARIVQETAAQSYVDIDQQAEHGARAQLRLSTMQLSVTAFIRRSPLAYWDVSGFDRERIDRATNIVAQGAKPTRRPRVGTGTVQKAT
jgi:hypothetical protein